MYLAFILFSFGLIIGIMPALVWSRMGGDDEWVRRHPRMKLLIRLDHFEVGLVIMLICSYFLYFYNICWVFGLALGTGLTLDDLLLHSYKKYWYHISIFKALKEWADIPDFTNLVEDLRKNRDLFLPD